MLEKKWPCFTQLSSQLFQINHFDKYQLFLILGNDGWETHLLNLNILAPYLVLQTQLLQLVAFPPWKRRFLARKRPQNSRELFWDRSSLSCLLSEHFRRGFFWCFFAIFRTTLFCFGFSACWLIVDLAVVPDFSVKFDKNANPSKSNLIHFNSKFSRLFLCPFLGYFQTSVNFKSW